MSNKVRPLGRKSGFTLVELLIVIAIIGVLSTVGVPTFRRMIQKSKKTEAQVNLGGLYTAEQAFLSEYGAYGNNLARLGFQVDGNAANMTYVIGFFNTTCVPTVDNATPNILPPVAGAIGAAINASYPAYYTTAPISAMSAVGPVNSATNAAVNKLTTQCYGAVGGAGFAGAGGAQVYNTGTGDSNKFTAAAVGVIAPGISKTAPATNTDTDLWTMDDQKLLANAQDGVK